MSLLVEGVLRGLSFLWRFALLETPLSFFSPALLRNFLLFCFFFRLALLLLFRLGLELLLPPESEPLDRFAPPCEGWPIALLPSLFEETPPPDWGVPPSGLEEEDLLFFFLPLSRACGLGSSFLASPPWGAPPSSWASLVPPAAECHEEAAPPESLSFLPSNGVASLGAPSAFPPCWYLAKATSAFLRARSSCSWADPEGDGAAPPRFCSSSEVDRAL